MTVISVVKKKNMSSKKPLEVGKLYQTKISISFYSDVSNGFVWLKNLESMTVIMILENGCFDRFTKIITEDGQVGYIELIPPFITKMEEQWKNQLTNVQ